jgi:DNA (cytosine-5)-methyltransferase 1
MLLIDFYCKAGGASMGYRRAGFDVLGVDIAPQPRYPFPFLRADALDVLNLRVEGAGYDVIHASPPCQAHSDTWRIRANGHPDLIGPTRELLRATGLPYIIENVVGAPLIEPVTLCGAMFGLRTYRHRLFESNLPLTVPEHPEHVAPQAKMGRPVREGEFQHIVGNFSGVALARETMGMPWANRDGLREAIPVAYTEYLGRQIRELLR